MGLTGFYRLIASRLEAWWFVIWRLTELPDFVSIAPRSGLAAKHFIDVGGKIAVV